MLLVRLLPSLGPKACLLPSFLCSYNVSIRDSGRGMSMVGLRYGTSSVQPGRGLRLCLWRTVTVTQGGAPGIIPKPSEPSHMSPFLPW